MFWGACCVSRNSCEYLLSGKCGQGNALIIIIGGQREVMLTRNDTMILYLKKRKGFIELALKYGYTILFWFNYRKCDIIAELHLYLLFLLEKMNFTNDELVLDCSLMVFLGVN